MDPVPSRSAFWVTFPATCSLTGARLILLWRLS
jgi:hypothetical protein